MGYLGYIRFLGILIFFYLLNFIDFIQLKIIFTDFANYKNLFVSLSFVPFVILIKSYRWYLLAKLYLPGLKFGPTFFVYSSSLFLGVITPAGILGELTKVLHFKNNTKINLIDASSSVIIDRFLDFLIILVIAIFSYFYIRYNSLFFSSFLTLTFILVCIIIINSKIFIKNEFFRDFKIKNFRLYNILFSIKKIFTSKNLLEIMTCLIITVLGQIISFIQVLYICKVLNLDFSSLYILAINSFSVLISLIPISVAGIGNRDALLMLLFSLKEVENEYALIFSSMYLIVFYLGTLIFGFISFLIKPVRFK